MVDGAAQLEEASCARWARLRMQPLIEGLLGLPAKKHYYCCYVENVEVYVHLYSYEVYMRSVCIVTKVA